MNKGNYFIKTLFLSVWLLGIPALAIAQAPSNNNQSGAISLTQKNNWCSALAAYTNVNATADGSSSSCGSPYNNVWFKFQAATSYLKLDVKTGSSEGTIQYPEIALWNSTNAEVVCVNNAGSTGDVSITTSVLTIGEWYYISVYTANSSSIYQGTFTLCINDQKLPDNKSDAIELIQKNSCSSLAAYSNVGSTPDGSGTSCGSPYNNVWFKFQATTAYIKVGVNTGAAEGTIQYPEIAIWNSANTEVLCGNNTGSTGDVSVTANALTIGEWYYISIYTSNSSSSYQGTFTLCVNDRKLPDDQIDAIELTQKNNWCSALAEYTNVDATQDGSYGSCGSPNNNVWFKFQASTPYARIDVKTGGAEGTIQGPQISLWDSNNAEVGCISNYSNMDVSVEKTNLTVGQWYSISVYTNNYGSSYQGTFSLCFSDQKGFNYKEGAVELTQKNNWCSGDAFYSNVGSTVDGTASSCSTSQGDVWFKFQAATAYIKLDLKTGATFGTLDYAQLVLRDNTGAALLCNDLFSSGTSTVEKTNLVIGQWYYATVSNWSGQQGTFSLCVSDQKFPDNKADAIELTQRNNWCSANAAYTNVGSTVDGSSSSCYYPNGDVWFKFQATTAYIKADIKTGSTFGSMSYPQAVLRNSTGVAIICNQGDASTNLASVEKTDLPSRQWYYISVGNWNGSMGSFTVCLSDQKGFNYKEGAVELTQKNNWCSADAFYSNLGSTVDGTASSCSSSQGDVWFKFQAATAYIKLDVKTGGTLGTLQYSQLVLRDNAGAALLCNQTSSSGTSSVEKLDLTIGQWYYVSVSNWNGSKGTFSLCANDQKFPDNIIDAAELTQKTNWCSDLAGYKNTGATQDGSFGSCGAMYNNVWFKFQAATPYIKIDVKTGSTEGTIQFPEISLWNSSNVEVVCGNTAGATEDVSIETGDLIIGQWYYLSVFSSQSLSSYEGTFSLCLNDQAPFNFKAGSLEIAQKNNWCSSLATYTNVGATQDGPSITCGQMNNNVWFKFQATTNYIKIDAKTGATEGTIKYPSIAIFNSANTQVTCNPGAGGSQDDVTAEVGNLTIGEWYYVSVFTSQTNASNQGTFTLCATDQTTFDNKLGALELTQKNNWCSALATYTNATATSDNGGGACGSIENGVWFKFQASTAYIKIQAKTGSTEGTIQYPEVGLYNSTFSPLTCQNNNVNTGDVVFSKSDLTVGQWYYFVVYNGVSGTSWRGTFTLCINDNPLCETPVTSYTAGTTQSCFNQATGSVSLSGSETGVNYFINGLLSKAGTGSAISWNGITSGSYTITAQRSTCPIVTISTVQITDLPAISLFNISSGGTFCATAPITLSGSSMGVNYQLKRTEDNSSVGSPVSGTGSVISFPGVTTSGTYTIVGTSTANSCTQLMTGNAPITINPLPVAYTVSGSSVCAGSVTAITLSNSQTGVNYQLKLNGVNSGVAKAGTGSALSWPNIATGGTYTIGATNTTTNCTTMMAGSSVLTFYAFPVAYNVSGGGTVCAGDGKDIKLSSSDFGMSYQLKLNGVNVGAPLSGTGFQLTWPNQTAAGTYAVSAINSNGATAGVTCSTAMNNSVSITINPLPNNTFVVSGGGTLTETVTQFVITLSNSESNINYQLQINGVNSGSVKTGNAVPITWTGQTTPGTYTVVGTNSSTGCKVQMSGSGLIIKSSNTIDFLNNLAFQYKYDGRHRMTHKKVPGADWIYLVYDKLDRLVMSQDGEQRKMNKWSVTKYDELNRPVMTAIYSHGAVATQLEMNNLISTTNLYESYTGGTTSHGYSLAVFPTDPAKLEVLTVTYYDNYNFISTLIGGTVYNGPSSVSTTGLPTGSKIKIIGQPIYLWSVAYYDDKYRVIKTISTNTKDQLAVDVTTATFDQNNDRLIATSTLYGSSPATSVARKFEYDHVGRLLKTWHNINNATAYTLLSLNQYNELGQLADKKLYSTEAEGTADNQRHFKQSVDYRYNIKGWLTRMNNSDVQSAANLSEDDANTLPDLFGMNLAYNTGLGTGNALLYNGNISAMKWSANQGFSSSKESAYNFSYDTLNRIKGASFLGKTAGVWSNPTNAFAETGYAYDLNGNILKMQRRSVDGTLIDNMTYDYGQGYKTNQLLKVTDSGNKSKGFIDGTNLDNDYAYNANGNMKIDQNKTISTIAYNYLNLPRTVIKTNGDSVTYVYDASGRKLSQKVYSANTLKKKTDYVDELFYENDTLKLVNHEEGRIVMTGAAEYQYHMKDHLGNVRLTFTTKVDIDDATATYETTSGGKFLKYSDSRRINSDLFDHTNNSTNSTGYAQRLNGTADEKYGLARSLSVMPGDKIHMEVFAKYVDPNSANWTAALTTLLNSIANGTAAAGTVIDGTGYQTNGTNHLGYTGILPTDNSSGTGPKAYLNYIMFDRDFNPIVTDVSQSNFVRLSNTPRETGNNVAHELLAADITVKQAGYLYIYLSNEEITPIEVYFDDFKVTQTKSPVVQQDDYYPFGLTFNSFTRENTFHQDFKYNGKELQDELNIGWLDYGARMYMPEIGRWGVIDPLAENDHNIDWSPYNYVVDNPIGNLDPDGKDWWGAGAEEAAKSAEESGSTSSSFSFGTPTPTPQKTNSPSIDLNTNFNLKFELDDTFISERNESNNKTRGIRGYLEDEKYKWGRLFKGDVLGFFKCIPPDAMHLGGFGGSSSATVKGIQIFLNGSKNITTPVLYSVYKGVTKTGEIYWGMTKNFAQRAAQHGNRFVSITEEYSGISTRGAARGLEQMKIDASGGIGIKNLQNSINSISTTNPNLMQYYQEAIQYLKSL